MSQPDSYCSKTELLLHIVYSIGFTVLVWETLGTAQNLEPLPVEKAALPLHLLTSVQGQITDSGVSTILYYQTF